MELRLAHGRDDPEEAMDGWGFDGPTLLQVHSMQLMYNETTTVKFLSIGAAHVAQVITGWPTWEEATLEMLRHGDLIEIRQQGMPSCFYADLFLSHGDIQKEAGEASLDVRRTANALQIALNSLEEKFRV